MSAIFRRNICDTVALCAEKHYGRWPQKFPRVFLPQPRKQLTQQVPGVDIRRPLQGGVQVHPETHVYQLPSQFGRSRNLAAHQNGGIRREACAVGVPKCSWISSSMLSHFDTGIHNLVTKLRCVLSGTSGIAGRANC